MAASASCPVLVFRSIEFQTYFESDSLHHSNGAFQADCESVDRLRFWRTWPVMPRDTAADTLRRHSLPISRFEADGGSARVALDTHRFDVAQVNNKPIFSRHNRFLPRR